MRSALRQGYEWASPYLAVMELRWSQLGTALAYGLGLALLDALAFLLFVPLLSGIPSQGDWPFLHRLPAALTDTLASRESRFLLLGGTLLALQTARVGLAYAHHVFTGRLHHQWNRRLADHLFGELIEFGQAYFDRRGVAGAWKALDARYELVRVLLGLERMLVNTLVIASHVVVMLVLSPPLTLLTLLFFAMEPIWLGFFGRKALHIARRVDTHSRQLHGQSYQVLSHLPLFRAYSRENQALEEARRLNQQIAEVGLEGWLWQGWNHRIRGLYASFTVLATLGFATFVLTPTGMDSVLLYLVFFYLLRVTLPMLGTFQEVAQDWAAALPRLEELRQILDEGRLTRTAHGRLKVAPLQSAVECRGLSFAYNCESQALRGLNCRLPAGQRIALVGASGSGKSTLVKLLMGFYPVPAGGLWWDDLPLDQADRASLRRQIAWIGQDAIVLPRSLRENLVFGLDPCPHDEALEQALDRAQLLDWVEGLPQGLDTMLADGGSNLSGGQKQRIAIARAILKEASLIILDEATSALDPQTEAWIQQSLGDLFEGRTVLIISHRWASLSLAEHVLVLDQGQLVEEGSRQQLLEAGGHFSRLFQVG